MNLTRLARLLVITTVVAASADGGQLEFDGGNLPTKLNYPEYISQFISKTESTTPTNIEPLILGGNIVPSGTKTYTTGVRPTANGTNFCGGSLITPTHVLTAAHCMAGDIQYVSVGTHFVSGTEDGEQLKVVKKIRHPKYASETNSYDFLVLELEQASSFSPIALAKADDSDIAGGGNVTVMGWGATSQGGNLSIELLRIDVPLLDMDACQGDSGGPLIAEQSSEDVLIGVVSWGDGCGRAGYPGVYARVSVAKEWLSSVATGIMFR
ncbi:unnamed protein product [Peronospora effusa]|nr:unnamed protein product [Peronospora effusa]